MMVKNRGLPSSLGEHYNQYLVELIQRATADWDPSCPVFPQWPAAIDSADTGERSGLAQSVWGGESGSAWTSADDEVLRAGADDAGDINGRTPASNLTASSKLYAKMMGENMPETRVHTREEKRKFRAELAQNYFQPGEGAGRLQQFQRYNFDGWAVKWNAFCDKIQQGTVPWVPVYRKTAKQLEEYLAETQRDANVMLTMYPLRDTAPALRSELQRPADGAAFSNSVAQVQPVPVGLSETVAAAARAAAAAAARGSAAQGEGASGEGAAGSGSGGPAATVGQGGSGSEGSGAPVADRAEPAAGGLAVQGGGAEGGGSERVAPIPILPAPASDMQQGANKEGPRRPQICIECGHCSFAFPEYHPPRRSGGGAQSQTGRLERMGRRIPLSQPEGLIPREQGGRRGLASRNSFPHARAPFAKSSLTRTKSLSPSSMPAIGRLFVLNLWTADLG